MASNKIFKARLRYAAMSAQKIRPYADLVRGQFVDVALEILSCYPARGARLVEQVISNARHNAEDRQGQAANIADLEIIEIRIDGGPMSRRFRPKARGSSNTYLKRTSHITVIIG
jgi:large subunit ribosomal protein L22